MKIVHNFDGLVKGATQGDGTARWKLCERSMAGYYWSPHLSVAKSVDVDVDRQCIALSAWLHPVASSKDDPAMR
jgi:hypothetical protein